MKQYIISEELGLAVLNYLASKPYQETFKFIDALQKLPDYVPENHKEQTLKSIKTLEEVK